MKRILAIAAAMFLLGSAPLVASASTVGATTSQSTTLTTGNLSSVSYSASASKGVEIQVAGSVSSVGPETCVNSCTGSTFSGTGSLTITQFNTAASTKQSFYGQQTTNSITCTTTAFADPFTTY